ncbi:PilZ domain-containing protein [Qipengyuania sp. XHP0211]|uniref:PilZ domain-containing protein n=1 Tax=Qipengyuania sp. XHP0211 TaxID=3038079 RepID=UPI00241E69D8|nr:PilZ domain-containing protein [Qipengyuania sp. XHP0211]MDG5751881.1 PilZ domain-containing protein [Qipengyuania sp. XHP0211]
MDRRKKDRSQTREAIRATIAGTDTVCTMRNLSQSGCMIEGDALPGNVGAPVTIQLTADLVVSGEVAWQLGQSMGVFFFRPIPLSTVRSFALDDWPLRSDWNVPSPSTSQ